VSRRKALLREVPVSKRAAVSARMRLVRWRKSQRGSSGMAKVKGLKPEVGVGGVESADEGGHGLLARLSRIRAAVTWSHPSIRRTRSTTSPPPHAEKQCQTFLWRSARKAVGLSPLWMGHGPARRSPRLRSLSIIP